MKIIYTDDTITVAEGDDLLEKITGANAGKYIAYTLKLACIPP